MIHELRKLWTSGWIIFLTLAIIGTNSVLFYNHCTQEPDGYNLHHIRELYSLPLEEIGPGLKELKNRASLSDEYLDPTLITGNLYDEIRLYTLVYTRKEETGDYSQTLRSLRDQTAMKALLFSSGDPFTEDVLAKTMEGYDRLESVQPWGDFPDGAEPFTRWRVVDLFVVFLSMFASMVLVVQEKNSGLLSLLRPTKRGHSPLYLRKYFSVTLFMVLGFLVIYGIELVIAGSLYGFGDLSRPVQAVYPYWGCPFAISVGEMLGVYLGSHLLMCWVLSSLFFFLCVSLRSPVAVLLTAGALGVGFLYLKSGSSLWLRGLCPMSALDPIMENGYLFLNFFGKAVPLHWVNLGVMVGVGLGSFAIGGIVFCRQSLIPRTKKRLSRFLSFKSSNLSLQEGWKLLFLHSGLILLLLFSAVQVIRYSSFEIPKNTFEFYYHSYCQTLSGEPNEEKDRFLAEEELRFAQIEEAKAQTKDIEEIETLERKLLPREAFHVAASRYRNLGPNQLYVYDSGYNRLYTEQGLADDLVSTILLTGVLILAFSGVLAVEQESGVHILIQTAGKERKSKRYKWLYALAFSLVAAVIAYLPQFLCVVRGYGLPLGYAQANSLSVFSILPHWISLNGVLVITRLIRVCVAVVACSGILFLSAKTKSTIFTILSSCAFLLLPLLLVLILS